jgi:hypothetical protein
MQDALDIANPILAQVVHADVLRDQSARKHTILQTLRRTMSARFTRIRRAWK